MIIATASQAKPWVAVENGGWRVEDRIALALMGYKGINQNNIVDAIRQLELRDVRVDRCTTYDDVLNFKDLREGTDTKYWAGKFNRSPNTIPNFKKFHSQASKYLRQVTFAIPDAEHTGRKGKPRCIEATLAKTQRRLAYRLEENYDPPAFGFELPNSGFINLDDFLSKNVPDRSAAIGLRGNSEWSLNDLRKRLKATGCNEVKIDHCPVMPTRYQKISYVVQQLGREVFTVSNIANFIWGIAGLVVGLFIRQLMI